MRRRPEGDDRMTLSWQPSLGGAAPMASSPPGSAVDSQLPQSAIAMSAIHHGFLEVHSDS